jgi:hypothetical protein
MPQSNNAKTEFAQKDINERIARNNEIIGIGTVSALQQRVDYTNSLVDAYNPAIKGIDAKIVSIGQSINQLKDEIVDLVEAAVGLTTTNTCATLDVGICTSWPGGISTCLVGYTIEYYDSVAASGWGFSSTSTNPFSATSIVYLSSASNSFGVGVGTFLTHTQNDSSYSAGVRVSLGSSATCVVTQTEIDRKDGEIATLRSQLTDYIGVVNKIRTQRSKSELERWGCFRAIEESRTDNEVLVGVLTAFTDSKYTNLFLK